jgi:hypothetical protein
MNLESAQIDHQSLIRYRDRYLKELKWVRLLDHGGDAARLPREGCFIRRSTIDAQSAQQPQTLFKEEAPQWVSPPAAVQDEQLIERLRRRSLKRLFITGEGGMGKTEYARLIAYRLAQSLDVAELIAVPVLFELKNLTDGTAEELFTRQLAGHDSPWLGALGSRGRLVFILDGLDEMPIDLGRGNIMLKQLLNRFEDCTFVVAGRPGSLGSLDTQFDDSTKHELKPLEIAEIVSYIGGYFRHRGKPSLAGEMIAYIHQNLGTMLSLLKSPFMLAYACEMYCDSTQPGQRRIPANPADLVEAAVKRIFSRRRTEQLGSGSPLPKSDALCIEALSTLAAFTLVGPPGDGGVQLSFPAESAENWLLQNSVHFKARGISHLIRHDGDAKDLLSRIAPHSGILFRTDNGKFMLSNRLVAEFLAAKWIVRHGYPNWPYRPPAASYTLTGDSYFRQIMDFLGDYVWSREHHNLVMAVHFELSRTRDGCTLLMTFVRWVLAQMETAIAFSISGYMALGAAFLAFHGEQSREFLPEIETIAHRIVPWQNQWWQSHAVIEFVGVLPADCKKSYRESLAKVNISPNSDSQGEWSETVNVVSAVSLAFAEDPVLRERARGQMSIALNSAVRDVHKHHRMIETAARCATASGFGGDAQLKQQAFSTLLKALEIATGDPKRNINAVCSLCSAAIASEFAGFSGLIEAARKALLLTLRTRREIVLEYLDGVTNLARLVAWGFADDVELNEMAREALYLSLIHYSSQGNENLEAIENIRVTAGLTFPQDVRLRGLVFEAMSKVIFSIFVKNWLQDPGTIERMGGTYQVVARSIAAGRTVGTGMDAVRNVLSLFLDASVEEPAGFAWLTCEIARSVSTGFAGDAELTEKAAKALSLAADAFAVNGHENADAVKLVAFAIITAFPSDAQLMGKALDGLTALLKKADQDPLAETSATKAISNAIARHFPGNLCAAAALDGKWGSVQTQEPDRWNEYLVFRGDFNGLVKWAGILGETWGLGSAKPIILETIRRAGDPEVAMSVLVAPREKIRRGLSAGILSTVLVENSGLLGADQNATGETLPQTTVSEHAYSEEVGEEDGWVPTPGELRIPQTLPNEGKTRITNAIDASISKSTAIACPDPTKLYVFRRIAKKCWQIAFGGEVGNFPLHREGFMHIAMILERQGRDISDIELKIQNGGEVPQSNSTQIRLDKKLLNASLAFKEQLERDLKMDLDIETRENKEEQLRDTNAILGSARRPGGKLRPFKSDAEKAQASVGNNLKAAYECLKHGGFHSAAAHFKAHIKPDGSFGHRYDGDILWEVSWTVPAGRTST